MIMRGRSRHQAGRRPGQGDELASVAAQVAARPEGKAQSRVSLVTDKRMSAQSYDSRTAYPLPSLKKLAPGPGHPFRKNWVPSRKYPTPATHITALIPPNRIYLSD